MYSDEARFLQHITQSSSTPEQIAEMERILSRTDPGSENEACLNISRPAVLGFAAFQGSHPKLKAAARTCKQEKVVCIYGMDNLYCLLFIKLNKGTFLDFLQYFLVIAKDKFLQN